MGSPVLLPIVAAQAAEAERRALERFRVADATRPERARPLDPLGLTPGSALDSLMRAGLVRDAGGGRYWLDEAAVAARRHAASPRAVKVLLVVLLALAMITLPLLFLVSPNR